MLFTESFIYSKCDITKVFLIQKHYLVQQVLMKIDCLDRELFFKSLLIKLFIQPKFFLSNFDFVEELFIQSINNAKHYLKKNLFFRAL